MSFDVFKNRVKKPSNHKNAFARFMADRGGQFAIMFALSAVPVLIAVGGCIDFVRAHTLQNRMQADLDAALVATAAKIDSASTADLKERVRRWLFAQSAVDSANYKIESIEVDRVGNKITGSVSSLMDTSLLKLAGMDTLDVHVSSAVQAPITSYMEVHIVLDKSPSMLLAANTADQQVMRNKIDCEFACHEKETPHWVNGKYYETNYDYSSQNGIELRTDVAIDAVEEVLDQIDMADHSHNHIKVALYTVGKTAKQVLPPTYSTSAARAELADDKAGLNSATSEDATYFDKSFNALKGMVGYAGDGSSAHKPLKLVLFLTDGVQSKRDWVIDSVDWRCTAGTWYNGKYYCTSFSSGGYWGYVTPINPDWCGYVKDRGPTMAVLYTEYLPIPIDWGYNDTLGSTMASSKYGPKWGGTMRKGVSSAISRHDYIDYALKDCASSSDLFMSASAADEIKEGLSTLFSRYSSSIRLTQ